MEEFYSVERRDITEAVEARLDSFHLLRLHHQKLVGTSAGGLITFTSILNKLPEKLGTNTSAQRNITNPTSRSFSLPSLTYNSISHHSTPSMSDIDCSLNGLSIFKY